MTTSTQRWVLGLSALASFMVVLDMLVVVTALPTIQRDLGASLEALEWTVNAYTLSFAVLLMTGAAVGDLLGRRLGFVVGLGVFAVASAACALAPSVGALVAARACQGAGAALVMPLALALMNAAFPPERRGWATGIYGGVTGLAAVVGPVVGGAVTQGIAWEWIFWLNVPIGLVAIPLVLMRTPESRGTRTALDLPGIVTGAVAAFGLVWALVRGNSAGWTSAETLVPLVAGLVAGVGFVAVERRVAAPMLPPRLFASRTFSSGNAAIFLLNAALTGSLFFVAQFFQVAGGYGALFAGLRLLPVGVVPLVLAPRAGALADRFGERALIVGGSLAMALGLGWLASVASPSAAYWTLVGPLTLVGLGLTLGVPAMTRAVVSQVALADLAKASGTFSTFRQLGGAFGVAVLGAVFAATGGYGTAGTFTDGFVPAMVVSGVLGLAAAVAGLVLPGTRTGLTRSPRPGGGSPRRAPAAANRS
ncbi:MFS transporter [Actinophytocola sp.]|uniref:MFS transporter n=1 Tax=Actinophytocola sp. TaxID=1872138 RepID=UPI0038999EDB